MAGIEPGLKTLELAGKAALKAIKPWMGLEGWRIRLKVLPHNDYLDEDGMGSVAMAHTIDGTREAVILMDASVNYDEVGGIPLTIAHELFHIKAGYAGVDPMSAKAEDFTVMRRAWERFVDEMADTISGLVMELEEKK